MLALLAAAQTAPAAGSIKTFGDWAAACDNVHACEMTSLYPGDGAMPDEGSGYDGAAISIVRGAGPAGGFIVEVTIMTHQTGETSVRVDDRVIAGGAPRDDVMRFTGGDAERIVAAMVKGKEMRITDIGDGTIGRISLSGSSAALRFIDAEQGRAGTMTAAVAKGTKPADAVPLAAALPRVPALRPSGKPATVTKAMRAAMDKAGDCAAVYEGGEGPLPEVETYALGGGKTLALLPCGNGAYNYSSVPFIVAGGKFDMAAFDQDPGGMGEGDSTTLVNAGWDPKTGQLSSHAKGRGVGDCGAGATYVWDGTRFRQIEAREMPECRGSANWLATWRAEPVLR
ncbi:MAG: DUF1176 domain-containing protein [Sphingomonas sp.]